MRAEAVRSCSKKDAHTSEGSAMLIPMQPYACLNIKPARIDVIARNSDKRAMCEEAENLPAIAQNIARRAAEQGQLPRLRALRSNRGPKNLRSQLRSESSTGMLRRNT